MATPLTFKFGTDITQATAGMNALATSVQSNMATIARSGTAASGQLRSAWQGTVASLLSSTALVGAALAGVVTLAAVRMNTLIEGLSKFGDRADDLRLPVDLLQALSIGADQARVSQDKLNEAIDHFTSVSKKSTKDAEDFYKALGLAGQTFVTAFKDAPSQAERLRVVSDAIKSLTNEQQRNKLASEAFGSSNERLLSVLGGGREQIAALIEQMRRLGLAVDENAVRAAQQARSELALLARVIGDDLSSALGRLIPLLVTLAPYLKAVTSGIGALGDVFTAILNPAGQSIDTLKNQIGIVGRELDGLKEKRERLAAGEPTTNVLPELRDWLRKKLGIDGESIADLDKAIEEVEARKARLQLAVELREKAGAKPPTEPGAFKPALGGAGGGGDAASRDVFDREEDRLKRHIAMLYADAAAVGQTAAEHERLRTEMQLLQAAEKVNDDLTTEMIDTYARLRGAMSAQQALAAAGIKLTDEQAAAFGRLTERAGTAAGALDQAKRGFAGVNDAARFAGDTIVTALENIIDGADAGTAALKALRHALLQAVISGQGPLAQILGLASTVQGGTGGIIGLLLGGIKLAEGGVMTDRGPLPLRRYAGGGIARSPQLAMYGEGRLPEAYVPLPDGRAIPVTIRAPSMPAAGGFGGGMTVNEYVIINAPSADPATALKIERIANDLANTRRQLPQAIGAVVTRHQVRGTRW